MEQRKALEEVIGKIHALADSLQVLVGTMQEQSLSSENISEQVSQPEKEVAPKKVVTHKEVRTLLAEISRSGKTSEVKQLITSFGAERLSDIEESKYAELMEKARTL